MDDVQNISATLYGKAEPTTARTTMSVREMQHLLGLGKTDSYWLLHKNFFEVILINDKMRIVISSFEKWYANQVKYHMTKEALGAEYTDYNLVVAGPLGMPTEQSTINGALKRLIEKNNLPKVVFHSFRHSSITYKLKLNGGDIKAVQGDSGHAQASMVTEQYAHILDDDRRLNAQRFDDFFYQHQGAEPEMPHQTAQSIPENSAVDADAAAALTKLLANPSMAELIKNLAKNL